MKNIFHLCHVQNNVSRQIKNQKIFLEIVKTFAHMTSVTEAATAAR